MNTLSIQDGSDESLRALLAQADPQAGQPAGTPGHLLGRVLDEETAPRPSTVTDSTSLAGTGAERSAATHPPRRSTLRRHWQGALLVAAGVCSLALATAAVLPGPGAGDMAGSGVGTVATEPGSEAGAARDAVSSADGSTALSSPADSTQSAGTAAETKSATSTERALVQSAELLVGAEDLQGERDAFVAKITALGGRVVSETVITQDRDGSQTGTGGYVGGGAEISSDTALSYPYPWYPSAPGIWLSVEVPADKYPQAVEAARSAGTVVQMQQSSYDVGTQVADVDARIDSLEASLARLQKLMGQAKDISDVITLEKAISQRQSELDSLRAQQRELANQTAMSRVSLTLMSPEDAEQTIAPEPSQTWWESFLAGLGQLWEWLGRALLILSPLLIALVVIWFVRRRGRRTGAGSAGTPAASDGGTPTTGEATPADA